MTMFSVSRHSSPLSVALVLATVFAVSVLSVSGQSCTPQTCPEGPVEAYFVSTDCSGSPTFYSYARFALDTCFSEQGVSGIYTSNDVGFRYTEYNNPTCTPNLANETSHSTFDVYNVCKRRSANSKRTDLAGGFESLMLLASVNATYPSPQNTQVDLSYPNFEEWAIIERCDEPDTCVREGQQAQYWENVNNGTCYPTQSIATYNISYNGQCYRDGTTDYISYSCVDENTYMLNRWVGEGCQRLYNVATRVKRCSEGSESLVCTATPLPPYTITNPTPQNGNAPEAEPPGSSAASLVPCALFLLSVIALLF